MVRCRTGDLVADQAVHGSDVDDAAVFCGNHGFLRNCAGNPEGPEEVDVHLIAELLIRDVFRGSDSARPRIVDQDINAAEFLHDGIHHRIDIGRVCDVTSHSKRLYSKLFGYFSRYFLNQILTACHSYDVCSLIGQGFCHLNTKSCGTTGNNRDLSFKIKIILHVSISCHMI